MANLLSMPAEIIEEFYSWLRHPDDIINLSTTCVYLYYNRDTDLINHLKSMRNVCNDINMITYKSNHKNSSRVLSGWKCKYKLSDTIFPVINCISFKSSRNCSREKFESTSPQKSKRSCQNNVVFITGHSYYKDWAFSRVSYGSIGTFAYNTNIGKVL